MAFITVAAMGTASLEGQAAPDAHVWISAALGAARGPDIGGGIAGIGQLNGHKFPHHAGLRLSVIADVAGFPDSGGDEVLVEVAALYGRGSGGENGYRYLAAGPSVVSVNECDDLIGADCVTVGVAGVAEADLTASVVGVGIQVFGNLNFKAPFLGMAVTLSLGYLP